MKYIYSTSQMLKLSLTLHTFSITDLVASLFLTTTALLDLNLLILLLPHYWSTKQIISGTHLSVFS